MKKEGRKKEPHKGKRKKTHGLKKRGEFCWD